jgi:hypothetical protein
MNWFTCKYFEFVTFKNTRYERSRSFQTDTECHFHKNFESVNHWKCSFIITFYVIYFYQLETKLLEIFNFVSVFVSFCESVATALHGFNRLLHIIKFEFLFLSSDDVCNSYFVSKFGNRNVLSRTLRFEKWPYKFCGQCLGSHYCVKGQRV